MEAEKTLTSLSELRGATTLRELIRGVTAITKVSKEETILAIDWITGGIVYPKNDWRQLLAEKAQLISTAEEDFEAPESDGGKHKSAIKGTDQESEKDDEVKELPQRTLEVGQTQMTTLTMGEILMETLQTG